MFYNKINGSLFVKLLAPMMIIFTLVALLLVVLIPKMMRQNAVEVATKSAVETVKQYKNIRGYYTKNVVGKVLAGSAMTASYTHKNNPDQIPLPATFIHDLSENFTDGGVKIQLYSNFPFPNRQSRQLDSFAQQAWKNLSQNPKQTISRQAVVNNLNVVRVAIADTMVAQGCVNCHNSHAESPKTDWHLGDVRGVLEVQVPIEEQLAAGNSLGIKVVLLVVTSVIIVLLITAWLFRKQVSTRLGLLVDSLEQLAKGDLSQRVEITGKDELSHIGVVYNRSVSQIEAALDKIHQLEEKQSHEVSLLKQSGESSYGAVQHLNSEMDKVANAMAEMTHAFHEVARLSQGSADAVQQTQQETQSGHQIVIENKSAITILSEKMTNAAEVVNKLEVDSQNIGGVLDVIRGVSEQTNLLALNAAIEAARAGEQGRGFAVVADEVRTLASRTQSSTDEIKVMITQLQQGAQAAVVAITEGNDQLEQSLHKAEQTSSVIEKIGEAMDQLMGLNNQIATATVEQNSVAKNINENMASIADFTKTTQSETAGVSASVAQLADSIEQVRCQLQQFNHRPVGMQHKINSMDTSEDRQDWTGAVRES